MIKFRAYLKKYERIVDVLEIDYRCNCIIWIDEHKYTEIEDFEDIELLQSTGLKDKNGAEIFEGDILKGPMDFGPAGFVESVAPVSYHKINGYQLHYFLLEHTEVIGNVYEDKNIKFGIVE